MTVAEMVDLLIELLKKRSDVVDASHILGSPGELGVSFVDGKTMFFIKVEPT